MKSLAFSKPFQYPHTDPPPLAHQPKAFFVLVSIFCTSAKNISVRAEWLRQSCQRHTSGGILRTRRQYHVSRCISPSDRRFTISSHSVGLLF